MTRSSEPRRRRKGLHHYRPKKVNIKELMTQTQRDTVPPPRVIHVQTRFYEQMASGQKTVESRPNYPCFRDLVPGTVVEFSNRFSGESFLAKITRRRISRDFATMLRKETIQSCLPDHDPEDLQRAVNTYHSFRNGTYKFIARRHGVVSLRFTLVDNQPVKHHKSVEWGEYDRNSLCSIFETVEKARRMRKFNW